MQIGEFFSLCNLHPWAYIALAINMVVVFLNGYTDGPNTIATIISSRAMKPRNAFLLSAICNLLGALTIGAFSTFISKVFGGGIIETVSGIVNFGNSNADQMLCAITCGLVAIIIVTVICTLLALPSSQSNCLIGGLTGAGLALMVLGNGGSIGVNPWIKVIIGFFGSLIFGFVLGYLFTKLIQVICRKMNKGKTNRFFNNGQIVSAAIINYVHGIQDGGKFIGISVLIVAILYQDANAGVALADAVNLLSGLNGWWIFLLPSLILGVSCFFGNRKLVKTLGRGMSLLNNYQAFATDIASSLGLLLATLFGLPLSTGTIKNTAIMGTGAAKSMRRVKWKKAFEIVGWNALVFPFSAIAAFIVCMIFIWTVR